MKKYLIFVFTFIILFFCNSCASNIKVTNGYDYSSMDRKTKIAHKKIEDFLFNVKQNKYSFTFHEDVKIQSVFVDKKAKSIDIEFSPELSFLPLRVELNDKIYQEIKTKLGWRFNKYKITVYALGQPISDLIPNLYRPDFDISRIPLQKQYSRPHITNLDKPNIITNGLNDSHIAIWHSHGWYYNNEIDRWEWMRPRLFQTVEDLLPMSFTIPYLFPMLENSGANLYVPRERDTQALEVIVDNDIKDPSIIETGKWLTSDKQGFAVGLPPYKSGDNPFKLGTFRYTKTDSQSSSTTCWIPNIPKTDKYAVYISYGKIDSAANDANYTVHHAGGSTTFSVNQQMGYETWIYLGTFKFYQGQNKENGSIVLTNQSDSPNRYIAAEGVRFGGGMGNIIRGGQISRRPRYQESSRYYLQYAGMPDSLYTIHADTNDYRDDYQRGEWVNYLKGNPYGPNTNREIDGLNIPIDLSIAFHTDAGIENNTSVGTLAIYRLADELGSNLFPDSTSRMANRDLADVIQTEIVKDIKQKHDPYWARRDLLDADYRSARTPNVPTVLLELLSHQNFYDMKFALNPQFRFDVSRSIYKGILKYISNRDQRGYTIHPLPVNHFGIELIDSLKIRLSWKPVSDPLEETANPTHYIIYTRINDSDFDNGFLVDTTEFYMKNLTPDVIYSYKITAVNKGGESFPSEILSVCLNKENEDPVLIINGFDRISGPQSYSSNGFEGFINLIDEGVPDKYDLSFTGVQFDYSPASPWTTNDLPGHGASYANYEAMIIPGNTFDFTYVHGISIKNAGHSFISVSDEFAEDSLFNLSKFPMIDLILGEEKTTYTSVDSSKQFVTFSDEMKLKLTQYCQNGGNLFLSGAYIGTELFTDKSQFDPDVMFAKNILKFNWATDHASQSGTVFSTGVFPELEEMSFNQSFHPTIYKVESPDAIDPIPGVSSSLLRYGDNHFSAGTYYNGNYKTVVLGFPFETIIDQQKRDALMNAVLDLLLQ